jgi:hypothetical protein
MGPGTATKSDNNMQAGMPTVLKHHRHLPQPPTTVTTAPPPGRGNSRRTGRR